MSTEIDKRIGLNIRAKRIKAGLSQTALGKALKEPVTFQQVQKYERGINRVAAAMLYEFATILGVPVGDLFDGVAAIIGGALCEPGLDIECNDGTHKLVSDYSRIQSPHTRKAVRQMVKAIALEASANMKRGMA